MSTSSVSGAPETLTPVTHRVSQAQLVKYADASGDHNPLHLDGDIASGTPYGKPIAHGMLVLASVALLSAMGIIGFVLIELLERITIPWHTSRRRQTHRPEATLVSVRHN